MVCSGCHDRTRKRGSSSHDDRNEKPERDAEPCRGSGIINSNEMTRHNGNADHNVVMTMAKTGNGRTGKTPL